ncbi:hypothetical protein F5883DRAFT_646607 [Diaporthe sp. PMI_573]|nr:hypothetical protein F5883DRAFT_646607 [Diaporthaceae sp. PMI_573]
MGSCINPILSFRYVMTHFLTILIFAQCSIAWSLDPFRASIQLEKRQTDPPPPDPPIPVIDGVQSTKRYIRAPARNQGTFWSGLPFPLTQSAAAAAGFQTLEQSVAPEILSQPDAQLDSPNSGQFWTWIDPFQDGRMGPNATINQDTFKVGCPSVPGSLEPPFGGGQCNYTVEASANPQVNTFSITNSLTTLAVRLLVTCFSATCGSGANPRPPRSVLSGATLAHRAAIVEPQPFDVMTGH